MVYYNVFFFSEGPSLVAYIFVNLHRVVIKSRGPGIVPG